MILRRSGLLCELLPSLGVSDAVEGRADVRGNSTSMAAGATLAARASHRGPAWCGPAGDHVVIRSFYGHPPQGSAKGTAHRAGWQRSRCGHGHPPAALSAPPRDRSGRLALPPPLMPGCPRQARRRPGTGGARTVHRGAPRAPPARHRVRAGAPAGSGARPAGARAGDADAVHGLARGPGDQPDRYRTGRRASAGQAAATRAVSSPGCACSYRACGRARWGGAVIPPACRRCFWSYAGPVLPGSETGL